MADTDITWKGAEALEVSGKTLEVGTFTGNDGKPTPFDADLISKIFENFTHPVPVYLTHLGADSQLIRDKLGFVTRIGKTPTGKLHFKSLVFDDDAKKNIFIDGYDSTSGEIDYKTNDITGVPIDATLKAIALVKNPSVPGTNVNVATVQLSKDNEENKGEIVTTVVKTFAATKTGIEKLLLEKGLTPDEVSSVMDASRDMHTREFTKHMSEKDTSIESLKAELSQATQARDQATAEATQYKEKYTHVMSGQVAALEASMKELGFSEPNKIGVDLPVDQRMTLLNSVKEDFVKAKDMTKTPESLGTKPSEADRKNAFNEALNELGLAPQYNELMKGKVI